MLDNLNKWIRKYRSGRIWLNKLRNKQTIKIYLPLLKRYCDATGLDPDELIQLKLEGQRQVGTQTEFQAEELHDSTINGLEITDHAKLSVSTTVQSFYKHNRRPLVEIRKFEIPEPKKRRPTLEDVETLAHNVKWKRDKAIIWFTASAPFRRQTVELLTWGDLQETGDPMVPIKIVVESARLKGKGKGRYRGLKQISFLHAFAYKQILAYKKELVRMMSKKYPNFQITKNTPLFISYKNGNGQVTPLLGAGIGDIFERGSLNAWGNLEEKRFSPHDMRDFVDNALKRARVVEVDRAPMLGHRIKGVEKHYQDPDHKDLLESFKRAIPYLTTSPQVTEKDKMVAIRASANQQIGIMITTIDSQIAIAQTEITKYEGMIKVAEQSKKLEPQKAKEYDDLIKWVKQQILVLRQNIAQMKDQKARLEKL